MIGIFDSGLGGLTVLKAIREEMPSIDVVYFGDTKNAPYGSRLRAEISAFTIEAIRLLRERGARSIVSACNSVSASLAVSLLDVFSLAPDILIEMVGPTVSYFNGSPARILLCATPATISSELYQGGFHMIGKEVEAFAIPDLAGAIESGFSDVVIEQLIRKAFEGKKIEDYDVLILACTHYPLVAPIFRKVLGESIMVFDPALAVAERVQKQLWPREVGDGKTHFILSKDSEPFRAQTAMLFQGSEYLIEILP